MSPRLTPVVLLAVAAALTGCSSSETDPGREPTAPRSSTAERAVGGMLLERGTDHGRGWALAADRDEQGRLCMALTTGPEGAALSRTCGLPDAAGDGYQFVAVPGPGGGFYYFGVVPEAAMSVKLDLAAGGSTTASTRPTPAQLVDTSRFFIVKSPSTEPGVATVTPLDGHGDPLPTQ